MKVKQEGFNNVWERKGYGHMDLEHDSDGQMFCSVRAYDTHDTTETLISHVCFAFFQADNIHFFFGRILHLGKCLKNMSLDDKVKK